MKRILLLPLLILSIYLKAENPPEPQNAPGGAGGDGFGTVTSPIDMYVYMLAIIAVFMIFFYVKKYYRNQTV